MFYLFSISLLAGLLLGGVIYGLVLGLQLLAQQFASKPVIARVPRVWDMDDVRSI